jgi:hypothetical protein
MGWSRLGLGAASAAAQYVVTHSQTAHNPINLAFLLDPLSKSEFLYFTFLYLTEGVFFLLTSPLMGDPIFHTNYPMDRESFLVEKLGFNIPPSVAFRLRFRWEDYVAKTLQEAQE